MSTVSILSEEPQWRSRNVRYFAGEWDAIQTILPEFDLVPFTAGQDEPANPFLQTVMRTPLSAAERPIPVGVVSHTYSLAPHRDVAWLCRKGLIDAGIKLGDLRYEVGLSELGEWMNFRIYFADSYSFRDARGAKLGLRLECFNSVDGSSRLVVLFGWLRFVCANGLVIGETKIEIKERHEHGLDLASITKRLRPAFEAVEADRLMMKKWEVEKVAIDDIATWANEKISGKWGKKAAARVFHICDAGKDVEIEDPFAPGDAGLLPIIGFPGSKRRGTKFGFECPQGGKAPTGSSPASPTRRYTVDAGDVPRPSTCRRCARTVAGGAIGRVAVWIICSAISVARRRGERHQHQAQRARRGADVTRGERRQDQAGRARRGTPPRMPAAPRRG